MKKLLAAGALVALFVSPALARSNPPMFDQTTTYQPDTNNGPYGEVIREGQVVGQDPDPSIPQSLGREWGSQGGD